MTIPNKTGMPSLRRILIIVGLVLFFFFLLFCWQLSGWSSSRPIDADRFASYGSFIGGILGAVSFVLLLYTYLLSLQQSSDNNFFSLLAVHDSVVRDLRSRKEEVGERIKEATDLFTTGELCEGLEDNELQKRCSDDYNRLQKGAIHDYFEILYFILHIKYMYVTPEPKAITDFFKDNNWSVGHFLRSFVSIVNFIHDSGVIGNRRSLYVQALKGRSTSDELRLAFYFILSREADAKEEACRLAGRFKSLGFDDFGGDPLIKKGDRDWFCSLV